MILSDRSLREAIAAGRLVIDPLDDDAIQPSSIDVRLDNRFRVFYTARHPYIDVKQPMEDLTELVEVKPDDAFILHPGEFVLGSTLEQVGSRTTWRPGWKEILSRAAGADDALHGRVSRSGVHRARDVGAVQRGQPADHAVPGDADRADRGVQAHHRGRAALRVAGVGSKYQGQRGPTPSRYWENFRSS